MIWSKLGEWSGTTTLYGTGQWLPHLMHPCASMLGIIGTLCWSSTKLLQLTLGSRFVCFPLVMESLSVVGSTKHLKLFLHSHLHDYSSSLLQLKGLAWIWPLLLFLQFDLFFIIYQFPLLEFFNVIQIEHSNE